MSSASLWGSALRANIVKAGSFTGGPSPLSGLVVSNLDYTPAALDNPLKGFEPNSGHSAGSRASVPHSMFHSVLPLNETVTNENAYNWSKIEGALNNGTNDGSQTTIGFFIDYPTWTNTAIPWYLISNGLATWTYTDYGNVYSLFPDYEDTNLHACLTNFIREFGARYDGDPRIAGIRMGTIGMWGEWHYGEGSMLSHWASLASQKVVMDAYTNAFQHTKIMMRYPAGTNNEAGGVATYRNDNYPVGYYDDSFCRTTIPTNYGCVSPEYGCTYQWAEMITANATNKWKQYPMFGEVGAEYTKCILSNPPCMMRGAQQSWSNCVYVTHTSWSDLSTVFYEVHLYAGGSYDYGEGGTNVLVAARQLGYELWVQSFSTWTNAGNLLGSVTVTNTGVAPFYYDWQVELRGTNAGAIQTWYPTWKISTVIPGDGSVTFTHTLTNAPTRPFTMLMRIVNPLTVGKPLRFANVNQHATVTNWLTLGVVP